MRLVFIAIKTTGLAPTGGHRIIDMAGFEMIDGRLTGREFHRLINPQRQVPLEAIDRHGIDNTLLQDQPAFHDVVIELIEFVAGSRTVMHNAPFGIAFFSAELKRIGWGVPQLMTAELIIDTLPLFLKLHPGQPWSRTALCERYGLALPAGEDWRGALADARLLGQLWGEVGMVDGERLPAINDTYSHYAKTSAKTQPMSDLTPSEMHSNPVSNEPNPEVPQSESDTKLQTMSLSALFDESLHIPDYQRSYSWRSNHVNDLLQDIFDRKSTYLMGTVILHKTGSEYDIVDGQQRLVTLTVLLHCLQMPGNSLNLPLLENSAFSTRAAISIRKTKEEIENFLSSKSQDEKTAFLKFLTADGANDHLQFHVLILSGPHALDLAYTFFDSVNSKGKKLSDFDLLKAHHLMHISTQDEKLATSHNTNWLMRDTEHADLFSKTLRRIRMWARGQDRDARHEWPDYNEFLPVVEPSHEAEHFFNRYMQPVVFKSWQRVDEKIVFKLDDATPGGEAMIPIKITQSIEGGDAFFVYTERYHRLYETMFRAQQETVSPKLIFVRNLANSINNEKLRDAFMAVMLLYVDKFGDDKLIESSVCIERIISGWRWKAWSVRIEGTLTHIRDKRLIPILLESVNSRYAFEQLLKIAKIIPREPLPNDISKGGYRWYYRVSLQDFYKNSPLMENLPIAQEVANFQSEKTIKEAI